MDDHKAKVLLIVEGTKTEPRFLRHLFDCFGISKTHEIISYGNNLYDLYRRMFQEGNPEDYDLLQVLKEAALPEKQWICNRPLRNQPRDILKRRPTII